MAAEDYFQTLPPPDTSVQALGIPDLRPAPVAPLPPPQMTYGPSPQDAERRKLIALAAAAFAIGGGRGAMGVPAGALTALHDAGQSDLQQQMLQGQEADKRFNWQQQAYQHDAANWERERLARELETQRKGQFLVTTLEKLKGDLGKAPDQNQADQLVEKYGQALQGAGFRGYDANSLRARGFKYLEPTAEERAKKAVAEAMANAKALGMDPNAVMGSSIQFALNPTDDPQPMPFAQVAKIGKIALPLGADGAPIVAIGKDKPGTIEDFVSRARKLAAASNGGPLSDQQTQDVDQKAIQHFKELGQDPDMKAINVGLKRLEIQSKQQQIANGGAEGSARMDRSYNERNKDLTALRTPVAQQVDRLGRLADAITQKTPQADALVAPELLSVMAGGSGSGLRMNEAEIARIVGGRSALESLKASAMKWNLDPAKALSITDAQRGQIRRLFSETAKRATAALDTIDTANQDLIDAPDVQTHRQILAGVKRALGQDPRKAIDAAVGVDGARASGLQKLGVP